MSETRDNGGQMHTIGIAEVLNDREQGKPSDLEQLESVIANPKGERKGEIPQVEANKVTVSSKGAAGFIDNAVRQNTIESDRAYREITVEIVRITNEQLKEHNKSKKPIRSDLLEFIKRLLATQFTVLVILLWGNRGLELGISETVFKVYIVSVFAETLAGLIIMIRYAFDTTQEVKLIAILNEIISHFKKFDEK